MNPARDGENQERPDRRHNVAVGVLSSRTRIRCARRTGVLPGRGRWCRRRNPLRRAASEGEPQRRAILVGPTARFRASSGQSPPLSGAAPLEQLPTRSRGTDRRVARPPTSGTGLGAWLRCPVVNGAGARGPCASGMRRGRAVLACPVERLAARGRLVPGRTASPRGGVLGLLVLLVPSPRWSSAREAGTAY